eukprot:TRINITY_DN1580_c0_g1_i2.p1 TRINITY_DN1580_c0_g1~~TRINITY_DN1580_c0_g1_i2.p1  ORF type:complete len:136 (+),score=11.76 TRINITY_DN1580_c0_g1_i2:63-470(+)
MSETKLRATHFYKGDRWVYLRSNIKGLTSHSLLRHEEAEFPVDRVQSWFTEDKRVVQVSYGDGCYVILCHRYDYDLPRVGKQSLFISEEFPEQKINAGWRNNERVNVLSYCMFYQYPKGERRGGEARKHLLNTFR